MQRLFFQLEDILGRYFTRSELAISRTKQLRDGDSRTSEYFRFDLLFLILSFIAITICSIAILFICIYLTGNWDTISMDNILKYSEMSKNSNISKSLLPILCLTNKLRLITDNKFFIKTIKLIIILTFIFLGYGIFVLPTILFSDKGEYKNFNNFGSSSVLEI